MTETIFGNKLFEV